MAIVVTGECFHKGEGKSKRKWAYAICTKCQKQLEVRHDSACVRKSCGCDRGTHRQSRIGGPGRSTRTYSTWQSMLNRCRNANAVDFARYGGRGISVCERWLKFELFFADMGERPKGASIDRIDVNGNYEPENCRWATAKEQARNRANTKWITVDGEKMTLLEASQRFGVDKATIFSRLRRNMNESEAAKTPLQVTRCELTVYGKAMPLRDWCAISGVKVSVARQRLSAGWTHKEAVFGRAK
jgi:hypothetical protein